MRASRPATCATCGSRTCLGRRQVETDLAAVRQLLRGKRVLITGAGGSIGSEIARQVRNFEPAHLALLDNDETHLHDLLVTLDGARTSSILADVRDRERMLEVFREHRPQVVFHAAAHKHVPILEDHPQEALLTNVLGTANVVEAAAAVDTERFVLISTDKAVRPTSVMGGSKRMAEDIVRGLSGQGHDPVRRPLRERARQPRVGRAHVPQPDRRRGTGDGDRSGDDPVLHERRGGGAAGAAGRRPRARRRGVHARDGRAGEHPRSREQPDPALRTRAGSRHRRAGDRRSTGREAPRGARRRRRGAGARRASGHRGADAAAPGPGGPAPPPPRDGGARRRRSPRRARGGHAPGRGAARGRVPVAAREAA